MKTAAPTLLSIDGRVASGAELLGRNRYQWWRDIDQQQLSLHSHTQDILGQLYGTFAEGRKLLGLTIDSAVQHGFFTDDATEYESLRLVWLAEIQKLTK